MRPERLPAFDLVVRAKDGKCRATIGGKSYTGWLSDGMAVLEAVRRKHRKAQP